MHWLNSLTTDHREAVYAAMRAIDTRAEQFRERSRQLAPPPNHLALGTESWEYQLKQEALYTFLRFLRHGEDPQTACTNACAWAVECVKSWNKAPRAVSLAGMPETLHRWTGMCDDTIETAMRSIHQAAPSNSSCTGRGDIVKKNAEAASREVWDRKVADVSTMTDLDVRKRMRSLEKILADARKDRDVKAITGLQDEIYTLKMANENEARRLSLRSAAHMIAAARRSEHPTNSAAYRRLVRRLEEPLTNHLSAAAILGESTGRRSIMDDRDILPTLAAASRLADHINRTRFPGKAKHFHGDTNQAFTGLDDR